MTPSAGSPALCVKCHSANIEVLCAIVQRLAVSRVPTPPGQLIAPQGGCTELVASTASSIKITLHRNASTATTFGSPTGFPQNPGKRCYCSYEIRLTNGHINWTETIRSACTCVWGIDRYISTFLPYNLDATIYNHSETLLVPPYEERTLALDRKLVQAICE
ncbi:hypothetical protein PISMIDRAFT_334974 [Pisolithus microcarpus 441]|uniref:Uncharacterized protein n=1 Tax=Pisolithus microcarpus 441 TaxID=765257 RepID=A0A0C9ZID0_9AGAM|nr:hypothetical protein BKA83DRAFT_2711514 [Pisolithus microcarpus]KIK25754.1 hypothetical protein PISMIDRAFT_334974 [Pisolithus microcarpus 441]